MTTYLWDSVFLFLLLPVWITNGDVVFCLSAGFELQLISFALRMCLHRVSYIPLLRRLFLCCAVRGMLTKQCDLYPGCSLKHKAAVDMWIYSKFSIQHVYLKLWSTPPSIQQGLMAVQWNWNRGQKYLFRHLYSVSVGATHRSLKINLGRGLKDSSLCRTLPTFELR